MSCAGWAESGKQSSPFIADQHSVPASSWRGTCLRMEVDPKLGPLSPQAPATLAMVPCSESVVFPTSTHRLPHHRTLHHNLHAHHEVWVVPHLSAELHPRARATGLLAPLLEVRVPYSVQLSKRHNLHRFHLHWLLDTTLSPPLLRCLGFGYPPITQNC